MAGAALLTAAAYQVPCTYRVDVGGADAPYVADFGARQRFQQTTWRWTLDASRLLFHDAGQVVPGALLRMRLAAPRPEGIPSPTLVVTVNDHPLARISPSAEFIEGAWPVAGAGTGDWTLSLESETFAKGDRRLGVQIDWAELEQAAGLQWPPLRTTLYVLAIAALLSVVPLPGMGSSPRALPLLGIVAAGAGLAAARESTVAILPVATTLLAALALAAQARRRHWAGQLEGAIDRRGLRRPGLAAGVTLALVSQCALTLRGPSLVAVSFLALGVTMAALLARPAEEGEVAAPAWKEAAIVGGLLILALALRTHALAAVPFSLFRDEARHGLIALRILHDPAYRPVFVPPPVSQPAAYMYLLAWVFRQWGVSLMTLRLVSALAGAAAVPLLFMVLRGLFGTRVAALASFGLAASSWHLTISRFAMPYVLPTLLALPAYLLLRRALEHGGELLSFAGAGLAIGLAQYGAQTSRVPILVATLMLAEAFFCRGSGGGIPRRRIATGALAMAVVASAVALPLVFAAIADTDAFFARTREVALWNGESGEGDYLWRLVLRNVVRYVGAFNVEGDWNGRHNLPGAPLLDPVSAVFAALGFLVVLRSLRERRARFLAIWLLAGLLPGFLSADAPTGLRIVEAAPVIYAIAALGASRVLGRARRSGLAAALAVVLVAFNAWTYFTRMYESPAVWRRGAAVASRLGETLRSLRASGSLPREAPILVPTAFLRNPDDEDVLRFLMEDSATLRVYDNGPMPTTGPAAIVIPNYADMWRLVAAEEGRYAMMARDARAEEALWRQRLEPLGLGEAVEGAPFPASDRPTFWLHRRP